MTIKLSHGYVKLEKLKYSGWYLHSIHVDENCRNKGLGERLMRKAIDKCGTPIYLLATAELGGDAERLVAFYKKMGFDKKKGSDIGYNYNMVLYT